MKGGQKAGNDRRIIRATKERHTKKKSSETVGKGKDFFKMSPASFLNIPLKEFSPEVKKMLVAGMVKGGKARVVKKTIKDKKSKDKQKK